jgi:hypothetical protein
MVRSLEGLSELEQDLIVHLKTGKDRALSLEEIKDKIKKETNEDRSLNEIYKALRNLMNYGSVRSHATNESKGEETREYYLSRVIGSGARNNAKLTGRANPFVDIGKYFKRITGAVLILFSIGFFTYQSASLSGAVVSSGLIKGEDFILPIVALFLGGFLVFSSLKFKTVKKKKK